MFRFRTRSVNYKENMKNGYQNISCPFCLVHPDSQIHSLKCIEVKSNISVRGNYEDIFKKTIPKEISETLMQISELRKELI